MIEGSPISKDENQQGPVPTVWRSTLFEIVNAFKEGDFALDRGVAGVRPITPDEAAQIAGNIASYGARLTSLSDETWQTSACQWMIGYWDVLVDLFTVEEGASDLAMAVRVYEEGSAFSFHVHSVHVP